MSASTVISLPALVYLPKENNNDESARLLRWRVASGARVVAEQALAEFETSKATFDLPAPVGGVVQYQHREGDEIANGSLVCLISEDGNAAFPADAPAVSQAPPSAAAVATAEPVKPVNPAPAIAPQPAPGVLTTRLSSAARALATERGVDLAQFAGRGLVRVSDVRALIGGTPPVASPARLESAPATPTASEDPPLVPGVPFRVVELSRSKRVEISQLQSGMRQTLPSSVTRACPTRSLRAAAERGRASLSAVLVFEVGRLLHKYPAFNACHSNGRTYQYEAVNVGFALDAGAGLKVPVLRCADQRSLAELSSELHEQQVLYLNEELPVAALAGGTFTITDLAQEGTAFFHPLISQGQGAILGVGAETFPPGAEWGVFHLTLAFDHQLANGRMAAQFLHDLAARLSGYEAGWGAGTVEEPYCRHCERTLSALREMRGFLVLEAGQPGVGGHVCSLCLKGF